MDHKQLEAFAREAAKPIKTEADLNNFQQMLTKVTVETALNVELDEHLGYEKNQPNANANSRNGHSSKTVKTTDGQFELNTPRDRDGTFEPLLVKKQQTRFTSMDQQVLYLYAKGMSTREIRDSFLEMYGAEVCAAVISKITDAVIDQVTEWQSRPLNAVYPIVYLDCLVIKVRQDKRVINKAVYLALGVHLEGHKELLGMWLSENEGAKFWLGVLTELQTRGVKDILIACVDGLKGFPEAIEAAFPRTQIQLCIVHMVRGSMRYVASKDHKAVAAELKQIYRSATEEEALLALDRFGEHWDGQYPQIAKSWRANWDNLNTLFLYPPEIRRAIYTTNAIESLNSVLRKSIKKRKLFPTDEAALKVVYLAIMQASKKWTMPIQNWKPALNHFMIEFEERLKDYI